MLIYYILMINYRKKYIKYKLKYNNLKRENISTNPEDQIVINGYAFKNIFNSKCENIEKKNICDRCTLFMAPGVSAGYQDFHQKLFQKFKNNIILDESEYKTFNKMERLLFLHRFYIDLEKREKPIIGCGFSESGSIHLHLLGDKNFCEMISKKVSAIFLFSPALAIKLDESSKDNNVINVEKILENIQEYNLNVYLIETGGNNYNEEDFMGNHKDYDTSTRRKLQKAFKPNNYLKLNDATHFIRTCPEQEKLLDYMYSKLREIL